MIPFGLLEMCRRLRSLEFLCGIQYPSITICTYEFCPLPETSRPSVIQPRMIDQCRSVFGKGNTVCECKTSPYVKDC